MNHSVHNSDRWHSFSFTLCFAQDYLLNCQICLSCKLRKGVVAFQLANANVQQWMGKEQQLYITIFE